MNFQALFPFIFIFFLIWPILEISPYPDLDNALRLHFFQIVIRRESFILNR